MTTTITTIEETGTERASQRVNGETVNQNTEHLPAEQRNAIRWMHAHYWDNNLGLSEAAQLIGYESSTLSRVFRGKYEGNVEDFALAIANFRKLILERATVNRPPYLETSLYREIEQCCNAARTYQKIGMIFGESQIGKTDGIEHYSTRDQYNHGMTVKVEMPVGGSLSSFIPVLRNRLRIGTRGRTGEHFDDIASKMHPNMLLIVDEFARAIPGTVADKTIEFLRALYDAKRFGMVLVGTNIFRDQMADEKMEPWLRQLHRRVLFRRQLPDRPSRADLNMFSGHYNLSPAEGEAYQLQKKVIMQHGLGVWLTTLAAANHKANKERKPITWQHVIKSHSFLAKLEEPTKQED